MKKVLLLGGAGFIGFSIAKYLAKKGGYKITTADNFFRAGGKIDSSLQTLLMSMILELFLMILQNQITF